MNILAIDTSTKYFCLVIAKGAKIVAREYKPLGRELSRLIIPHIDMALKKAKLSLCDIDYFGIGVGPGSFTGLRVGLATIKGLMFGLNKKVFTVSSLDIIASSVFKDKALVCPVVDAKRSLIYSAIYKTGRRKSKYLLVSVKDLLKTVKEKVTFLGDGLLVYKNDIRRHLKEPVVFLDESFWYPLPESLLRLGLEKIKSREFSDINKIVPLYLYPKECQIKGANR